MDMSVMRNKFLTIVCCTTLALGASACGSKATPAANAATATASDSGKIKEDSTAEVSRRIHDIYSEVFAQYNKSQETLRMPNIDESLYCSKAWIADKQAVRRAEENHPGEMGCFEYDYWVQGQDWNELSFGDIRPTRVTTEKADATITVHNMGETAEVRLKLVKENGRWMIDNIDNARETMRKYLENN